MEKWEYCFLVGTNALHFFSPNNWRTEPLKDYVESKTKDKKRLNEFERYNYSIMYLLDDGWQPIGDREFRRVYILKE